jgi:D-alanine-D-alanine ligase
LKKLRVGVIFGGRSGEHEISIRSACSVIEAFDCNKFDVLPIAITKEGKWLSPPDATRLLAAGRSSPPSQFAKQTSGDVAIIGDPSHQGLVSLEANGRPLPSEQLDVVLPLLHGPYGEDGTIQGLLEMAQIPYVGCGVLASSCGMDKVAMKSLFKEAGLPICRYIWFLRSHWNEHPDDVIRRVKREIGFPCFVKPANLGSSVGVSRAVDKGSLQRAVESAAQYDRKIIVEEGLEAREIECAIIGNDEPQASLPGEYVVHDETARFLDYTEKYTSTGHVQFVVPAPISKQLTAKIQQMAIRAFQAIDGAGLARVDFFLLRGSRKLLINELNTMPGLTEVSGYPKMWEASGMPFQRVLDTLIKLAFDRHSEKAKNRTSI